MTHALAFFNAWLAPWVYIACSAYAVLLAVRVMKNEARHADEMFALIKVMQDASDKSLEIVGQQGAVLEKHQTAIEELKQAEVEIKHVIMLNDAPRVLEALKREAERRQAEKEVKPN